MNRDEAIAILRHMKTRVVTDDLATTIRVGKENEAIDFALTDMKICGLNNTGWVSMDDFLPPGGGEYLTAYHPCHWDHVDEGVTFIDVDTWRGKTTWAKRKYHHVTHWMPMPPKPAKEDA